VSPPRRAAPGERRVRLEELAPDLYGVIGRGGMPNAAFVVADGGVLAIDSLYSPAYAAEMLELVREVTPHPVRIVVNTHHHADHVFGNAALGADRVVAHELALAELRRLGDGYVDAVRGRRPDLADELEGTRLQLPTETVGGFAVVEYAGTRVELTHHGRTAHSPGDLVVRVQGTDALIAGDLVFHGVMPPMLDGDVHGLRDTLAELARDDAAVVLPGHGPPGGAPLLQDQLELIDLILAVTAEALASGGDESDAVSALSPRLSDRIAMAERLPAWVRQAAAGPDGPPR
jgi:cyclase